MGHGSLARHSSIRSQLQRALGDIGTVLDRVPRGAGEYTAAGWYARIGENGSGELVFLGDHAGVAYVTISRLTDTE